MAFFEESFNAESESAQDCVENYSETQQHLTEFRQAQSLFLYDKATVKLTDFVRSLNPLMSNCVSSTSEYADVAMFYVYTFQYPKKILFNVIYDMGEIYDSAMSLYDLS